MERVSQHLLAAGGAEIEVEVHLGQSDLAVDDLLAWVRRAAEAVPGLFELRPFHLERNGRCPYDCALVRLLRKQDEMMTLHCSTVNAVREAQVDRFVPAIPHGPDDLE